MMRFRIPLLAFLVTIIVTAILAVTIYSSGPASAQAPTTQELQTDVNTLNALIELPYVNWEGGYHNLRRADIYQRMDWSQDECSAPLAGLGFSAPFREACFRHDMMWRSLAAIDGATGRVWNERNRYRADRQLWDDTAAVCLADYQSGDPSGGMGAALCAAASLGFYMGVHGYYRTNLTPDERDSVTDEDHAMYDDGMRVMESSSCAYSDQGVGSRCLPINYVERNGLPFAPQNMAIIPTGTAIEMELVRANLQSLEGAPGPLPTPPVDQVSRPPRNTGDLEISVASPFIVASDRNLSCINSATSRMLHADSPATPSPRWTEH